MLKTINYAIFKCTDCGVLIKVQPSELIERVECTCTAKQEVTKPKRVKAKKV